MSSRRAHSYARNVHLTPAQELHEAIETGTATDVQCLLARDDVDPSVGVDMSTPLHITAAMGDAELVALLLDYGADVDATDAFGRTALHRAAQSHSPNTIALLLSAGSSATTVDRTGSTPVHVVARNTYSNGILVPLLQHGGMNVLNLMNHAGMTPYACAVAANIAGNVHILSEAVLWYDMGGGATDAGIGVHAGGGMLV